MWFIDTETTELGRSPWLLVLYALPSVNFADYVLMTNVPLMSCVSSAWIGTETLIAVSVTFQYQLKSPGRWQRESLRFTKTSFVTLFFASSLKCRLIKSFRSCRKKIRVADFNVLKISLILLNYVKYRSFFSGIRDKHHVLRCKGAYCVQFLFKMGDVLS
jgi:hypothetical protein